MRISDWSSDVCSSDLQPVAGQYHALARAAYPPPHHRTPQIARLRAVERREAGGIVGGQPRQPANASNGSAACRGRVCPYVYVWVVAVTLKKTASGLTQRSTAYENKYK